MNNDVTRMLETIEKGEARPEDLLPVVYQELRRLAASRMAREAPGHTLQPTALVHEAWMRLSPGGKSPTWENQAHFFGAAGEAMRRILVEHARRKHAQKRGGHAEKIPLDQVEGWLAAPAEELLSVNDSLDQLAAEDPEAAELVKLRYFVGLTMEEAANALNIKKRRAEALWTYARVWLRRAIQRFDDDSP